MHEKEPPRIQLAQLPTPLVELRNLAARTGVPKLLMKRDDLSGFELSGNKVRKLEYVVADALARGATTLVTHGGFQSNHCRATAAVGARLGLRVRLLLRSADATPVPKGNFFLNQMFGASISLHTPDQYNSRLAELIEEAMEAEHAAGQVPYFFPVGASVPLGCWGYVRCMHELIGQLDRQLPVDIFVATSSCGTQVGLMLGKTLFGCDNWRILGVPVSDSLEHFQHEVRRLERQAVAEYALDLEEGDTPVELLDGFIGEGYAMPYPEELETIRQMARTEGVLLDHTYTGKAMTGMLASLARREGGPARPEALPLFMHTGGAFGLLARLDLFRD